MNIIVTVDDERMATIAKVADDLRAAGMNVVDVMKNIGIIAGSADDLTPLRAVEGVLAVEQDKEMFLS